MDAVKGTEEYGNWINAEDLDQKTVNSWKKQKPLYYLVRSLQIKEESKALHGLNLENKIQLGECKEGS